jgi:hypothetical protein
MVKIAQVLVSTVVKLTGKLKQRCNAGKKYGMPGSGTTYATDKCKRDELINNFFMRVIQNQLPVLLKK